jgi:hypothetical protein
MALPGNAGQFLRRAFSVREEYRLCRPEKAVPGSDVSEQHQALPSTAALVAT